MNLLLTTDFDFMVVAGYFLSGSDVLTDPFPVSLNIIEGRFWFRFFPERLKVLDFDFCITVNLLPDKLRTLLKSLYFG